MTQPQQQPAVPQPQPTPMWWQMTVPQHDVVVVSIVSCTGQHVAFMDADGALRIGQQLMDMGRQAKSGLIVPQGNVQLPPPSPPNGGR